MPPGHRLFAATYDFLTGPGEQRLLGPVRAEVVRPAIGRVLEVGVGTGANFPYYQPGVVSELFATDPDPFMLKRAERKAGKLALPINFRLSPAEDLPFPSEAFDTVVVTLVLCSVEDPARALAEIRRVLRPGGILRFIEHVRAEDGFTARFQDVLTPAWRQMVGGCRLNRQTHRDIEAAGFTIEKFREHRLRGTPLHKLIVGVARS